MNRHDKFIITVQIPIFIAGMIFIGLGLKQPNFWVKYFDIVFGVFDMIFATTITTSNIRDMIRGRYNG